MSKIKTEWNFKSGYQQILTRYDLIMYGIGSTIGAGIFALTGVAVQYTGPSLWISFLVGGIVQMSTAMTYAELCARFPYNGSAFAYVYATFGEFAAWLVGWNTFAFYGASGSGLARALTAFWHGLLLKFGITLPVWLIAQPFFGMKLNLLAVIFMVICYFASSKGTHTTASANSGLTIAKLVTLGFIVFMAALQFDSTNMTPHVKEEYGWHGTVHGATIVYFASIGFDFISTISEEAKNTELDAPYSMQFTVIVCTVIYILVAIALTGMGLGQGSDFAAETAMADAFQKSGLPWMSYFIYFCAVFGISASLLIHFMGTVRLLQSFARDGLLPEMFERYDPATGIPTIASYYSLGFFAFLSFTYDLEELTEIISLGTLVMFSFVQACGIHLRYREEFPSSGMANRFKWNSGIGWTWIFYILCFISSGIVQHKLWWPVSAASFAICIAALYRVSMFEQINLPKQGMYKYPCMPWLAGVGVYFNLILAWETSRMTWINLFVFTALGGIIYFSYGIKHSKTK